MPITREKGDRCGSGTTPPARYSRRSRAAEDLTKVLASTPPIDGAAPVPLVSENRSQQGRERKRAKGKSTDDADASGHSDVGSAYEQFLHRLQHVLPTDDLFFREVQLFSWQRVLFSTHVFYVGEGTTVRVGSPPPRSH